ncbi:hypothetical protein RGQ29_030032 [Quercus rubra]|uniref:Uncharacterized protein n=1 Tax=Quercus rubra TaxID=3512 RepID=A0AAN7IGK5_QUERU|nr:hypothetical protein RGQ29_030032 [Quercus rubra]
MYVYHSLKKHSLNYLPNQSSFNFSLEFEFIKSLGYELDCRSGDCGSLEQVSTFKIEPEKDEIPVNGNSFYRLEMIRIQLFSSHGHPTVVEVEDFVKAQPDAIAHSAAKIISCLKAGGEKTIQALKSLCWRCKGIQGEPPFMHITCML